MRKPEGKTHWSVRTLAKATGVGRDTVHQILRRADLKPHQVGTFSQSPDPDFAAKVVDVVGLYMHPPENAVVLCVDEKTQVLGPGQDSAFTADAPSSDRAAYS